MMPDYDRGSNRELIGLLIILLGFGLLMNTMGILPMIPYFRVVQRFWLPAVFIGIGALLLSRRESHDRFGPGLFFVILGAIIFLGNLGTLTPGIGRWIFPALLIWIGVVFATRNSRARTYNREHRGPRPFGSGGSGNPGETGSDNPREPRQSTDSSDFIVASAFLGGFNRKCGSQQFRGGDITAFMGGGKLDLRDARIQGTEAVLDIFAMMGGVEIEIPRDWVVEPRFTPILGGYEDKTNPKDQGSQRLVIQGTAIMGGITVKS